MNKKTAKLLASLVFLMLFSAFSAFIFSGTLTFAEPVFPSGSDDSARFKSFSPVASKPSWIDQDNNGIADTLDHEIADRIANGTAQDYVNVTVTLKASPTNRDADDFISSGGYLTTSAWTAATYGFGGTIACTNLKSFVQRCPDVLLVEKEAVGKACIAYAAQQVGARPYVWTTLGLQGDPNSSIAFLDSGIDASQSDFSPGYGDRDFSKKIVGWRDQVGSTLFPVDDNGHGSYVVGLAAGNGFFSIDASGNAKATWGSRYSTTVTNDKYVVASMMVNKTGPIRLSVKWSNNFTGSGKARLSAVNLYFAGKTTNRDLWTQVASASPLNQETFYSITYNVSSIPANGYDMYQIALVFGDDGWRAGYGIGGPIYVALNWSLPYAPSPDGFPAWTGIAPQSKLVGVKVLNSAGTLTSTQIIDGINWVIANRMTYHITVASLSLGFAGEVSSVDSAVLNLVNSGVSTIVAAGNGGPGPNSIFSPGSVDEAISVGAVNQFDHLTDYSSQGGTSYYTGKTTKPDVLAPGGSYYAAPLYSADSNFNDAKGEFADIQANDLAPIVGTSVTTPIVSGSAQILVQAMGGFAAWNWTRSQALQPKMILLMTASETYPNLRETYSSDVSPTLERGGKDAHEGYGRLNLDAAVDALLKPYTVGAVATDTLGKPPTIADVSVVGQRLAWARNVRLASGYSYNFSLNVPFGADYDLYLYNSTGTSYGEPAIVAKSVNASTGGTEQFWVTAPYTGTYYLVVKRATETTGIGVFKVVSSCPVNVTLNTPGLLSASNVVHYTQNGALKSGSIAAGMFSDLADNASILTIESLVNVSGGQRRLSNVAAFTVQPDALFTANYYTQYYISIISTHGSPTPSQWVNQSSGVTVSVTSPTEVGADSSRWVCSGYSLDGGALQQGIKYTLSNIQTPHTIVFTWQQQFYLNVNSSYGSPAGTGWYDSDTSTSASLFSGVVSGGAGVQYVFTGWSGDVSGVSMTSDAITMNGAKNVSANWKPQYYLNVSSAYGNSSGSGWYDSGTSASAAVSPLIVSGQNGTRYIFHGWVGEATGAVLPSDSVIMNASKSVAAKWKTQYFLDLSANFGSVSSMSGWQDAGSNVTISAIAPATVSGEQYVWAGWSGTYPGTDNSISITLSGAVTEKASWIHQYMLTTSSPYGSPTPTTDWFDAGTEVHASVDSPDALSFLMHRVCNGWTGTGSVPSTGTETGLTFTIDQASSITWNWETEYILPNTAAMIAVITALTALAIFEICRSRRSKQKEEPTALT